MKIKILIVIVIACLLLVSGSTIIFKNSESDSQNKYYQSVNSVDSKMYVLVNSTVYSSLKDELKIYKNDVESMKGIDVKIYNNSYSSPNQVRKFLVDGYEKDDLIGTFFVGNLPYAEYKLDLAEGFDDRFPIDLYYTDLDDTWEDNNGDGCLDEHEGPTHELKPDIWFGRICMQTDWEDEISLYENYFDKVHRYRIGELRLPHKALQYVDDDWVNWTEEYNQGLENLYRDFTVINDKATTTADDYSKRLHDGYEWIQIHCHANHSAKRHAFKINDGPKGSGGNFNSRDLYENGQKSLFSNIFTCGSANYSVDNYLCGWYTLTDNYGLASIGTTKPGGMLNFKDYYEPLLEGKSIGEAMKEWWKDHGETNRWWFYGMTTIGDPTLSPGYLYEDSGKKDYIPHSPIRIDSNNDFHNQAVSQSWPGNGTEDDPYIIQGYGIDGGSSGNCIYIGNTTVHFVIKDCYLYDADRNEQKYHRNTGTLLHDVKNGMLKDNLILDNKWNGIYLTKTEDTVVEKNIIKSNSKSGIKLYEDCFNNLFRKNNISFNREYGIGVHLIKSDENEFINNNVSHNHQGFYNEMSDSNNFTRNTVLSNERYGLNLRSSCGNRIYDNEISSGSGIFISDCKGTMVVRNRIYENFEGLSVYKSEDIYMSSNVMSDDCSNILGDCVNLTFVNNTMINEGIDLIGSPYIDKLRNWNTHIIDTSNTVNGKPIYYWKNREGGEVPPDAGQIILANCSGVKVSDQNLTDSYTGITLGYSDNNLIVNNTISHNRAGIEVSNSDKNIFRHNEITENQIGGFSFQSNSDYNHIMDNTISTNVMIGMTFFDGCEYNKIYKNNISNNSKGISFKNSSDENEIYHNNFIENNYQVYMFCGNNTWYNETLREGNYWSDYSGNDSNGDGIGEDPKYIMGSSGVSDKYPLMEPYSGEINNAPDKPSDPNPEDGAIDVSLYPVLSVNISDPDSDKLNVTFFDADDETVIFEAKGVEIEKLHGRVETMSLESLKGDTTYDWYVEVSDGTTTVRSDIWSFTTKKDDTTSPTADAGEDKKVKVDEEFTLDASSSSDDDEIISYEWDLGNGQTETGEAVKYQYKEAGTYTVELTVTDNAGNTDTDTISIKVEEKEDGNGIPGFTLMVIIFSIFLAMLYKYKGNFK